MKVDNAHHVRALVSKLNSRTDAAKFELEKIHSIHRSYIEYTQIEQKIQESVIHKLNQQVYLFKENAKRMRAVLRVPRLTKEYHDQIK